jgi:hypothetical protein
LVELPKYFSKYFDELGFSILILELIGSEYESKFSSKYSPDEYSKFVIIVSFGLILPKFQLI